jgi:uncharacterized protein
MQPQIEVTLNCNLSCDYCFQDHTNKAVMNDRTLKNVIDKWVAYIKETEPHQKEMTFYWHGGETLLAGIDFFKRVLELEYTYPEYRFENKLQTNGAAMTEKMAKFLVDNEFRVGFSLDGPEDIQNRHRVLKSGRKGSFKAVMKGILNYKKYTKVPYIPVIAVVSKYTVERGAKVFYEFFRELGASVQFQPFDITWSNLLDENFRPEECDIMPDTDEYGQFVIDLFDLWFHDDPDKILIHDLKNEIKVLLAPKVGYNREIIDKKRCSLDRIIIDPTGNMFSCDMYINNEKTALGNINRDPIDEIFKKKNALWKDIKTYFRKGNNAFKCLTCEYGHSCPGGCLTCMKYNFLVLKGYSFESPAVIEDINTFFSENFPDCGETYYCRALKTYRKHIEREVKKEMKKEDEAERAKRSAQEDHV